jgi:hypothetical protein
MKCQHDAYVCPHPRKSGYFVYCADCELITNSHPTQDAAVKAWMNGKTHKAKQANNLTDLNTITASALKDGNNGY